MQENQRLIDLGWVDANPDKYGVKQFSETDESNISFPSQIYEEDLESSEATGVWAEMRASKIIEILLQENVDVIWEIGAGHGNVAIPLNQSGIATIAVEPLYSGAKALSKRGFTTYAQTLEQLKLPDACISAVGVFDVLEHLPDPSQLLDEIYRVLEPGGLLLCSVPAYQWLFSEHDKKIGHFRRYTRKSLCSLLRTSGFENTKMHNLFFFFIFPSFIVRRVPYLLRVRDVNPQKFSRTDNSLLQLASPLLRILFKIENILKLPWGLSILSTSKKPQGSFESA